MSTSSASLSSKYELETFPYATGAEVSVRIELTKAGWAVGTVAGPPEEEEEEEEEREENVNDDKTKKTLLTSSRRRQRHVVLVAPGCANYVTTERPFPVPVGRTVTAIVTRLPPLPLPLPTTTTTTTRRRRTTAGRTAHHHHHADGEGDRDGDVTYGRPICTLRSGSGSRTTGGAGATTTPTTTLPISSAAAAAASFSVVTGLPIGTRVHGRVVDVSHALFVVVEVDVDVAGTTHVGRVHVTEMADQVGGDDVVVAVVVVVVAVRAPQGRGRGGRRGVG